MKFASQLFVFYEPFKSTFKCLLLCTFAQSLFVDFNQVT